MNKKYFEGKLQEIYNHHHLPYPYSWQDDITILQQIAHDQRNACVEAARVQIDKTMRKKENVGKWFPDLPEIVAAVTTAEIEES